MFCKADRVVVTKEGHPKFNVHGTVVRIDSFEGASCAVVKFDDDSTYMWLEHSDLVLEYF